MFKAEVGAEQQQATADSEDDREDDLDDAAGADEAEQRAARTGFSRIAGTGTGDLGR